MALSMWRNGAAPCRCDPLQVHVNGPRAGLPHRPHVFRATIVVNGRTVGEQLLLNCSRCKSTWRAD